MTREETISYLGLDKLQPKEETSSKSVFDLDQDMYGKVFTLLDKNESDWEEDSNELDNSDESVMHSKFFCSTGELSLDADLDNDIYTITIVDKD